MPEFIPSLNISLEGENASGKTGFALSGPYPLVACVFDLGYIRSIYGGLWQRFEGLDIKVHEYDPAVRAHTSLWEGHDITIFKCPKPIQTDPVRVRGYTQLWEYYNSRMGLATADPYIRTLVVDTMTEARRTKAEAHLQTLQESDPLTAKPRIQLQAVEYGKVNPHIKSQYTDAASKGKNLIVTHHLTDEYKEGRNAEGQLVRMATGELVMDGMGDTYDHVDIAVRLVGRAGNGEFHTEAEFKKCGFVPQLKGTKHKDLHWDSLMSLMELYLGERVVFPERVPAD